MTIISLSSSVKLVSNWSLMYRQYRRMIRMAKKPNVVFVLGGPGAGKGTQCANIVQV